MKQIRWGILGLGAIARQFAKGLAFCPGAELLAVGSRTIEKAGAFAAEFGVPRAYASYEALLADPEIDVVYIATPHTSHKHVALLCLRAKKPVLCEKPFALNASEAEQMIECARRNDTFLMEAMWTRFLPPIVKVREWLAENRIGEPRMLQADFGFVAPPDPKGRHLNLALGGGALLDVGVYTLSLASMVFGGAPQRLTGFAHRGQTGADDQSAMILGYPEGQLAVLSCAVQTRTPHEARILGTRGSIVIPRFWHAEQATLNLYGQGSETVAPETKGNGYEFEAMEVGRCIRAGRKESDTLPLEETLSIMRTMDALRSQWGLKYPQEP
jgi:predicted dehydrogenase